MWEEDVDDEQSNIAQLERSGGCGTDRSAGRGSGGDSRRGAGRGAGGGAVAGRPSMGRGANRAAARRVFVSDSDEDDDDGEEDDWEGDDFQRQVTPPYRELLHCATRCLPSFSPENA